MNCKKTENSSNNNNNYFISRISSVGKNEGGRKKDKHREGERNGGNHTSTRTSTEYAEGKEGKKGNRGKRMYKGGIHQYKHKTMQGRDVKVNYALLTVST